MLAPGIPKLAFRHHVRSAIWFLFRRRPITRYAHSPRIRNLVLLRQGFVFDASPPFLHQLDIYASRGPSFMSGCLDPFGFLFFHLHRAGLCPGLFVFGDEGVLYAVVVAVDFDAVHRGFGEGTVGLLQGVLFGQV